MDRPFDRHGKNGLVVCQDAMFALNRGPLVGTNGGGTRLRVVGECKQRCLTDD
jgi:hypothetical protein